MSESPHYVPTCLICDSALSEPEIRLNRNWHFDCEKCFYCGDTMPNAERILKCLEERIKPCHTTCHKTFLFGQFKSHVLPVTKAHIDALNSEINSFFPAVNPDTADVQQLYGLLISLQECASNVSLCLSLTKDKLLIRESQNFNHEVREKQKKERAEKLVTETEKIAREEKTAMFAAERADPMLRARRKAIEGFIAIGISKEQAEAMVSAQEQKAKGQVQ